jgi:hypothetical protein
MTTSTPRTARLPAERPRAGRRRKGSQIALVGVAALATLPVAGLGWLFLTAPGRYSRDARRARAGEAGPLLIDRQLPGFDATLVCEIEVDAPPEVTYDAIGETNLLDPVVRGLFRVRELPDRFLRWVNSEPAPPTPRSVTFDDLVQPGLGMVVVAEEPGTEIVVGSVGRFWEKDYGWRPLEAHEFASFQEPGYAKLAIGFRVEPHGEGGTLLRYEARTATTDESARRQFRRYWRVIQPGVALVMRRALGLIRDEAQNRVANRLR